MDQKTKIDFELKWKKFFGDSELPIIFYFSNELSGAVKAAVPKGRSCLICELSKVRSGESKAYNNAALACGGAKRYLGFAQGMRPDFEYFLSYGIPGKMEGERYIRTPEMVKEIQKNQVKLAHNKEYIIFKRWDKMEVYDDPDVVIFFATPDVLSGLFTLANFDQVSHDSSIAPFGAGCGSIVHYPWLEKDRKNPRAVIGMFDPSARPCVGADILTFAVPMVKFRNMIGYMEESFLITHTWDVVLKRINKR
jgi:hypothetical protein